MASYEFRGKLKVILKMTESASGFRKREFVVATEEQYPQLIKFEVQNDKCVLISPFVVGDEIELDFNMRGNEWVDPTGKTVYFLTFVAWRIKKIVNNRVEPTNEGSPHIQHQFNFLPADEVFGPIKNEAFNSDLPENDLPF